MGARQTEAGARSESKSKKLEKEAVVKSSGGRGGGYKSVVQLGVEVEEEETHLTQRLVTFADTCTHTNTRAVSLQWLCGLTD